MRMDNGQLILGKVFVRYMKENPIYEKSFRLAVTIVEIYKCLVDEKKEYILSKQMLRSGTSIGANVREGIEGQSKKDFVSKMSIALKEAVETEYWLDLLTETKYLSEEVSDEICSRLDEIIRMLNSIIKTSKQNMDL